MMKRPVEPLERLLTIREVAEFENVSVKTVRRWIDRGALPVLRNGRIVRIHPRDLRNFRLRQQMETEG